MMNFRYHLVSLIAVFLALAVGVVLGAGPLQSRIARSIDSTPTQSSSGNVAETQALQQRLTAEAKGVKAMSDRLTADSLNGANVVTVALPGAHSDDVTSARQALQHAGAKLTGGVTLTDNWDLQGMAQYRETLSTTLSSRIPTIPKDATAEEVIAYSLVHVMTTVGAERDIAYEILSDANTPIMQSDDQFKGEAHAIVVIGPRQSADFLFSTDENATSRSVAAWNGLAKASASAPKSAVFIGDAATENSMVSQIRQSSIPVTTVDQVGTESANTAMVLALPSASAQQRAFGTGFGAKDLFPPLPSQR